MAQTQILNRRIRSVKNAKQITKAMEVVAASRMRRVKEAAAKARTYGQLADSIISQISGTPLTTHHPYFRPSRSAGKLYIVFSSDRGLAGAFNSNVFSKTLACFTEDENNGLSPQVIVFGRKGARFFSRFEGVELIGDYEDVDDAPDINVFASVIETINHGFSQGQFGAVNIIYTEFLSTLSQNVRNLQLLPITPVQDPDAPRLAYELEPTSESVLKEAIKIYLEAQLMRAKVDASASEYAMRMVAMNNANRNALDLIDHLTLELNATRQAAITQEIAEITGGANAVA